MGKKNITNIQSTVLSIIIEHVITNGNKYIERRLLDNEFKNTTVGIEVVESYPNDSDEIIKKKVEQALMHLRKKGDIEHYKNKKGKWTVTRKTTSKNVKEKVICQALKKEYKIVCQDCGKTTHSFKREKQCKLCKSRKVKTEFFNNFCAIKKRYIGKPKEYCNLLVQTDYSKIHKKELKVGEAIQKIPKCEYFSKEKGNINVKTKTQLFDILVNQFEDKLEITPELIEILDDFNKNRKLEK